jgi:NADP-dependent aldehyde dehydrogenase
LFRWKLYLGAGQLTRQFFAIRGSATAHCAHPPSPNRGSSLPLHGLSLIGSQTASPEGPVFHGFDPATGEALEPTYYSASDADIKQAAQLAAEAFPVYSHLSGKGKAEFLRTIATSLESLTEEIVPRACHETGLPEGRIRGELGRTTAQLRLFASVVEEGSWLDARIDPALPDRKPLPRADIRSMLRPIGPVAVFGASNFPLAFSVAGGDTASALAAGNPVIVKAHPSHPGTSELAGQAIRAAVTTCGLPEGVFSLLFDAGIEVGKTLVTHPLVKAVGFTGSAAAGKALAALAASRAVPIPCYAEMGSVNPVFVLPGAMAAHGDKIAAGLLNSFTLGSGQFCTKPGLVFVPSADASLAFVTALKNGVSQMKPQTMLNSGIAAKFRTAIEDRTSHAYTMLLSQSPAGHGPGCTTDVALFESTADSLAGNPSFAHEVFGPTTLLVTYGAKQELLAAAHAMEGHLTATIHGTEQDLEENRELIAVLESKVGRLLFNGFPTGVEVCHAMVHGGPWPATSDGRSTSVGTQAIYRFTRPVCYQDFPEAVLPDELKNTNPLGILRMVNGSMTRDPII